MAFIRLSSNDLMSFMFLVNVWVLLQIKCHACYDFEVFCISLLVFHKFLEPSRCVTLKFDSTAHYSNVGDGFIHHS